MSAEPHAEVIPDFRTSARNKHAICWTVATLRILPSLFPCIFILAASIGSIQILYAAVALHWVIIGTENAIGRPLSKVATASLLSRSTLFEDVCLLFWPFLHLAALVAAFCLIIDIQPTARQIFAIGAIFGYSINIFSAAAGHEMMHRQNGPARIFSAALYAAMLYPHFPLVHLASHHRLAGSTKDCQTPQPGQTIHSYLYQALCGGFRCLWHPEAATLDMHLRSRLLGSTFGLALLSLVGSWRILMFLLVQGVFSFIVIETLNYVQHYKQTAPWADSDSDLQLANQDLNFISRAILFNLPLHASHHKDQDIHCANLAPVLNAPSYCWGYWTSFWLAWIPPLWNYLHQREAESSS